MKLYKALNTREHSNRSLSQLTTKNRSDLTTTRYKKRNKTTSLYIRCKDLLNTRRLIRSQQSKISHIKLKGLDLIESLKDEVLIITNS